MPKEYTQKRANEVGAIAEQAKKILRALEQENIKNTQTLLNMVEQQRAIEKYINHIQNELGWIQDNQETLKRLATQRENADETINELRQRIAACSREIETLGSSLRSMSEKHLTQAKKHAKELEQLKKGEHCVKQLNTLQHALHRQLTAKGLISGRNRPQPKV